MIGASITPTQEAAINRHIEFRRKIAARAIPDAGICLRPKREEEPLPPAVDPVAQWRQEQWQQRQLAIHPLPIRTWFSVLEDITPHGDIPPSIAEIQKATSAFYKVSRTDMCSVRRTADIVRPRQVAMYLARSMTLHGLPSIGRLFGGRDHTTVLHAHRKIERLITIDGALADEVSAIRARLST